MPTNNYLGLPIEGEITHGEKKANQLPIEELTPLFERVLKSDRLQALKWRQYTPYFNDGDTCVFGVNEPMIQVTGIPEDAGDWSDGFVDTWSMKDYLPTIGPDLAVDFKELSDAMLSDKFDQALLDLFGDHAIITLRPGQNIQVEYYEHD